jgi:glutamate 5-kinase
MKKREQQIRRDLTQAKRVVVKIGSRVLVQRTGRPEMRRMRTLVKDIARLRRQGVDVTVVSSGAVGAGMEALHLTSRPRNLPDLQMAAAVGQNRLMARYDELFAKERCKIGQILLTHDDLNNRQRHLNVRNTMMNLLRHEIIPIVNENDVVSVDEIKVGDNDVLASLVALLIQADLLILLTTVNGLREPAGGNRTRRVSFLDEIDDSVLALTAGKGSDISTGGMASKLLAAERAATAGIPAIIANGHKTGIIQDIFDGRDTGTLLHLDEKHRQGMSGRKRWIAFFHRASGSLLLDAGACTAIIEKGRSLLPIGIRGVEGNFEPGAVVNLRNPAGTVIARGLTDYSSEQCRTIMGHKTSEIQSLLGTKDYDEVIHRDNMVLIKSI